MKKNLSKLPILALLLVAIAAIGWQATPVFSAFTPYKLTGRTKALSLSTMQAPLLDVRTYGATGNGSTNDRAAIQAAIDAGTAVSTGAQVYLPRGTYLVTSSLELKSNVRLVGDGVMSVLKRGWDGSTTANGVIQITGARSNCSVEDLKIDGQKATYTGNGNHGIYGNTGGYSYVSMNRLVVTDCSAGVIFLATTGAHGSNVSLTNSSVLNSGAHGVIFQDYVDNASIVGNYVYRTGLVTSDRPGITMGRNAVNQVCSENIVDLNNEATGTSAHGISIDTASYVICNNNLIKNCVGYGIEVGFVSVGVFNSNTVDTNNVRGGIVLSGNSANGGRNTDVVVSGNTIKNSKADKSTAGAGIYAFITAADGIVLHERITISNNNVTGCKTGMQLENIRELTAQGNTVTDCYWAGMYVYQTDQAKLSENHISGCNTNASASYAGLRVLLTSALDDVEVSNNRVVGSGASGNTGYEDLFVTIDGATGTPPITVLAPYDFVPYVNNASALGTTSKRWQGNFTSINANGALTLSGAVSLTNALTFSTSGVATPFVYTPNFTDATALNLGISQTMVLTAGATNATKDQRGYNGVVRVDGTGGIGSGVLIRAVHGDAQYNQTAGIATSAIVAGISGTARNTNASTVGTLSAGYFGHVISGAGNVTNAEGVTIITPTWSSTGVGVTTSGLHIKDQSKSGGTTSYNLLSDAVTQSGGATTVFNALFNGGQVKIESGATGTTALLLNTPASPTARVFQVNVNGTFKAGVNPSGALRGQGLQLDPVAAALTGNTTLTSSSQQVQICDTTAGGFTLTFPLAASAENGLLYTVVNIGSANTLTIARSGAEAFITNGSLTGTTVSLTSGQCATFIASTMTSKWIMVSKNF